MVLISKLLSAVIAAILPSRTRLLLQFSAISTIAALFVGLFSGAAMSWWFLRRRQRGQQPRIEDLQRHLASRQAETVRLREQVYALQQEAAAARTATPGASEPPSPSAGWAPITLEEPEASAPEQLETELLDAQLAHGSASLAEAEVLEEHAESTALPAVQPADLGESDLFAEIVVEDVLPLPEVETLAAELATHTDQPPAGTEMTPSEIERLESGAGAGGLAGVAGAVTVEEP